MTPEVTRDVCLLARMMASNLYCSQIEDLMFEVRITSSLNFHAYKSILLNSLNSGSCLCGDAMMSFGHEQMSCISPQRKMQSTI